MLETSHVIYLKATPEAIYERIKEENHRPLLRKNFSVEKIASIMKLREKNYQKADITIDTTGKTTYDVVKEILGNDYDENWYPEEERERDRRNLAIASYKCCKEYERILKGEVQV